MLRLLQFGRFHFTRSASPGPSSGSTPRRTPQHRSAFSQDYAAASEARAAARLKHSRSSAPSHHLQAAIHSNPGAMPAEAHAACSKADPEPSCQQPEPSCQQPEPSWQSLSVSRQELSLEFTLPTGQSFRWRQHGPGEFIGVIGTRVVQMKQTPGDVLFRVLARGPQAAPAGHPDPASSSLETLAADEAAVRGYFHLDERGALAGSCSSSGSSGSSGGIQGAGTLSGLVERWSKCDERFAAISPYFPGARMLRQDPVECLFQFICSSNNHISRIHGMVERLCQAYGTPLLLTTASQALLQPRQEDKQLLGSPGVKLEVKLEAAQEPCTPASAAGTSGAAPPAPKARRKAGTKAAAQPAAAAPTSAASPSPPPQLCFHAFPTLEQLSRATEQELRAAGFGYRAKFITGSVAVLSSKEGGGHAWLMALRQQPYRQAAEELCALPGIGPKVSACICLFSLDKHEAIPVDTHVWQIATRYYLPHLRGKALTKKVHEDVQQAFEQRFGAFAGWAHNTLFISELASQREQLPEALRPKQAKGGKRRKRQVASSDEESEEF